MYGARAALLSHSIPIGRRTVTDTGGGCSRTAGSGSTMSRGAGRRTITGAGSLTADAGFGRLMDTIVRAEAGGLRRTSSSIFLTTTSAGIRSDIIDVDTTIIGITRRRGILKLALVRRGLS